MVQPPTVPVISGAEGLLRLLALSRYPGRLPEPEEEPSGRLGRLLERYRTYRDTGEPWTLAERSTAYVEPNDGGRFYTRAVIDFAPLVWGLGIEAQHEPHGGAYSHNWFTKTTYLTLTIGPLHFGVTHEWGTNK